MTEDCSQSSDRLSEHIDSEDWGAAIAVLDTCWSHLLAADPHVVRRTMAALPSDVLQQHPRWASGMQYFERMSSEPTSTMRFRDGIPTAPVGLLDVLASLTAEAAGLRARGSFTAATATVTEARSLVTEATPDALRSLAVALPELTYQWAMTWEFSGAVDRAILEYTEAYDFAKVAGNAPTEALAAGSIAWMHALAGRTDDAQSWLDRVPDTTGHAWHERTAVVTRLSRALLSIDALDKTAARAELVGIDQRAAGERWPLRQYLAALVAESSDAALTLLIDLDTYARTNPPEMSERGAIQAVFILARMHLAARMQDSPRTEPSRDEQRAGIGELASGILTIAAASIAARAGDYRRAGSLAERVRAAATSSPRLLISALALLAAARLSHGAEEDAAEVFRLAATLARDRALYFPLTVVPAQDLERLLATTTDILPADVPVALLSTTPTSAPDPLRSLSRGERRVLDELLRGSTTTEVAAALVLSPNTVKTQARSIFRKAGVHSRAELLLVAARFGYTAPD